MFIAKMELSDGIHVGALAAAVTDEEIMQVQALQAAGLYVAPPPFKEVRANIDDVMANINQHMFVAKHSGRLVAMTLVTKVIKTGIRMGYVDEIVTLPEYSSQGLAASLHIFVERYARHNHLRTLEVTSDDRLSQQASHELYWHLGYTARERDVFTRLIDE